MTGSSSGIFRIPKEVQCFRYVQEPCVYLKWLNTLIRFYNCFHCTLSVSACNNLFFFTCFSSKHQELPEQVVLFLEKLLERDTISHTTLRQLDKCYNFSRGNAEVCWLYLDEGTTPWTLFKGLRIKGLIIINFSLCYLCFIRKSGHKNQIIDHTWWI